MGHQHVALDVKAQQKFDHSQQSVEISWIYLDIVPNTEVIFFLVLRVNLLGGYQLSSSQSLMNLKRKLKESNWNQLLLIEDQEVGSKLDELSHNLMSNLEFYFFDENVGDSHCSFQVVRVLHFFFIELFEILGARVPDEGMVDAQIGLFLLLTVLILSTLFLFVEPKFLKDLEEKIDKF